MQQLTNHNSKYQNSTANRTTQQFTKHNDKRENTNYKTQETKKKTQQQITKLNDKQANARTHKTPKRKQNTAANRKTAQSDQKSN